MTRGSRGGRGGRGGARGNRFRLPPVKPVDSLRPVSGLLRDDAIEIVDTEDMLELYEHGFFGKGTVSRRVPNRGVFEVLFAPEEFEAERQIAEAAEAAVKAAESGEGAIVPLAVTSPAVAPTSAAEPMAKRARLETSQKADNSAGSNDFDEVTVASLVASLGTKITESVVVTDQMSIAASRSLDPRADVLTTIAADFEKRISKAPLPEAFTAAAIASSHSQDLMSFEQARAVSHYISCPPPRTREASAALRESIAESSASASAAGEGEAPKLVVIGKGAPEGSKAMAGPSTSSSAASATSSAVGSGAMKETSILEPEAAMYLLLNGPPGCLTIRISPKEREKYKSIININDEEDEDKPLTPQQFWLICCARIGNFPARYYVYQHYRLGGWVVREGSIFGCDFCLYSKGPGWDHAPHCITVTPLRLAVGGASVGQTGEDADKGAAISSSSSHKEGGEREMRIRTPPRAILSDWTEVHAVGRVVNNVKKHNVAAYVTLRVPAQSAAAVASAADDNTSANYYPQAIAQLLSDPTTAIAGMSLQAQLFSRWHMTSDMTKKANAMMARAALAVTRAQEEAEAQAQAQGQGEGEVGDGEGETSAANLVQHIDLGLLEGHRSAPGAPGSSTFNANTGAGGEAVVMNKQAVKHRVRQLLMAQQQQQNTKDTTTKAGDGKKKEGGAAGSSHGGSSSAVSIQPSLWLPCTSDEEPIAVSLLAKDIICYERVLYSLQYPPSSSSASASSASAAAEVEVPSYLAASWNALLSSAEPLRVTAEEAIGSHFSSFAGTTSEAAAVIASNALQRVDSLSLHVEDPSLFQPAPILGLVFPPSSKAAKGPGFGFASAAPPPAPLSPLVSQQVHAVHHSLRTRLLAAALMPASASFSELVEKAKEGLRLCASASGAASAAEASAKDDAAAAAANNRGWYVRSADWTKLRAALPATASSTTTK
jgi:tRNA intron endonuclease, catalytic C-terminal domain